MEEFSQQFLPASEKYVTMEEVRALIANSMTGITSPLTVKSSYMQSADFVSGSKGWRFDSIGNLEANNGYFRGDITGANGTFSGTITATSGAIAGWAIAATAISNGNMSISSSTGINFNSVFTVNASGAMTATSGTIGGWTLGATTISATSITLDSGNQRISVGATSPILIDGANKKIESSNYVSGYAGSGFHIDENLMEVGNIACRGLIRTSVFQKDVISTVGGNLMVLDGDVLATDMTAADSSTMTTKATTTFAVGDILRIKDGTNDEWFTISNTASAPTYTVTRDRASAYGANTNPAWSKGATIVNYGQSGDGGLYMTASESNAPYLSVFTHAGSPWSALTTRLKIGNLNGYLGYTSDLYGIGIGETGDSMSYDPTNGLRITGSITGGTIRTSTEDYPNVLIDSNGLTLHGESLIFKTSTGSSTGTLYGGGSSVFLRSETDIDMTLQCQGDFAIRAGTTSGNFLTYDNSTQHIYINAPEDGKSIYMGRGVSGSTIFIYDSIQPVNDNLVSIGSAIKRVKDVWTHTVYLKPISTAPSTPSAGRIYYDSDDNHFYGYNGTSWVQLDNA